MPTMKAVQISRPGGNFELVEREVPVSSPRQVRIKVEACEVCHSDVAIKEGVFPWLQYLRIPGHEVVGIVDTVGTEVTPGNRESASGWAGTAATASLACYGGDLISKNLPLLDPTAHES